MFLCSTDPVSQCACVCAAQECKILAQPQLRRVPVSAFRFPLSAFPPLLFPPAFRFPLYSSRSSVQAVRVGSQLTWIGLVAGLYLVVAGGELGAATNSSVRLVKVLPHFIDHQGRVALNPSLFERDAYQYQLRNHHEERGGLLFEVQWKSRAVKSLNLKVEMRGIRGKNATTSVLEQSVRSHGLFSTWSRVGLKGDAYTQFGELSAWRATLWEGDKLVAEQKSFLW